VAGAATAIRSPPASSTDTSGKSFSAGHLAEALRVAKDLVAHPGKPHTFGLCFLHPTAFHASEACWSREEVAARVPRIKPHLRPVSGQSLQQWEDAAEQRRERSANRRKRRSQSTASGVKDAAAIGAKDAAATGAKIASAAGAKGAAAAGAKNAVAPAGAKAADKGGSDTSAAPASA
jgi:hypothetical protein